MKRFILDVETYSNYFLVMSMDLETSAVRHWEMYEGHPLDVPGLRAALEEGTLITFNGRNYDLPIISLAMMPHTNNQDLKDASDRIIKSDLRPWSFYKQYECPELALDHIDIMEPTPGVQVSLKSYAGRIHAPTMQDLPIEPNAFITAEQRVVLRKYCRNDLDVTARLYRKIEGRITLREQMSQQYEVDLRSKSDAQIAEEVIKHECGGDIRKPVIAPGTSFRYRSPGFITFQTAVLQAAHAMIKGADYVVADTGSIEMPEELETLKLEIGTSKYQLGIGGLHSTEKSMSHTTDADYVLSDHDVASYYPSVILLLNLFPKHIGPKFIEVYRSIVERRLTAKHNGDTIVNESLKIVLNGSFGKFGSKYSILYSPDLLIQTTLTGQLALLMLIEALELADIPVVSANTDGLVIKCPRNKIIERDALIWRWEWFSGFETEQTDYAAIYSKDVNNYLAIKPTGKIKAKGLYAEAGLMKNPTGAIAVDAVVAKLTSGADVATTIRACNDITRFIVIRGVKGGAVQDGKYLGKTVRWYYSTATRDKTINYKTNGNKVAKSDGAKALMTLPATLPDDIDYSVYTEEATQILKAIGATAS